ncbi:MAG: ABC transporter substrate-binding protein [Actinomycetota bacterium]
MTSAGTAASGETDDGERRFLAPAVMVKRHRRPRWALAALLTFVLVTSACGSNGDDETTANDVATEAEADSESDSETIAVGDEAEGDVDTEVAPSDDVAVQGGELALGMETEIVGMRPWDDACGSTCYNIFAALYDKLMESTADGSYEGWLLESIEPNEDFTAWIGRLRQGITFHNGRELTAQSIEDMFPIQQAGSQSAGQISASNLAKVEATGDYEVTWTLSQPNSAFPAYLSRAQLGFVFDAEAAADGDAFNEAPVGTGPFVFASRDIDNETILERNDDYWMTDQNGIQLPYLDRLSFRPIPDEITRLDATRSGTTQVAHTLRQGTIRDARAARDKGADLFLYEFQGNNVGGGMFNVLVPPFDDVRVRRGVVLMSPQEQLIEALGGQGISLEGTQWFSPDSPWYSEAVAATYLDFDFDAGVAALQEYIDDPERSDGKAVGEPIDTELPCPPDPTLIAYQQVLEQTWSASGLINVELTNYDQQTHIDYALGADNGFVGNHTTHCWRFGTDEDPSTFLNGAFAPPTAEIAEAAGLEGVVSPINWSNYFDGEMFGDLVAAIRTTDFDERHALYEAVMTKLNEDAVFWYAGHTATALIVDSSIKGLNSWSLPSGTLGVGHPNAEGRWAQAWIAPS